VSTLNHEVRQLPSKPGQLEAASTSLGMPRRVLVKGMEGVPATVVVRVVQGHVWLSISPPFTWEAIMDPAKVDELVHVLELAQDEAQQMAAARPAGAPRPGKAVMRAITRGSEV
jgi:hypothetical protein